MTLINQHVHSVSAFAPATCANVAVGFDILGFALEKIGDTVTLTRRNDNKLIIETIKSNEAIPEDPDKNTASFVIKKLCQELNLELGFSIQIQKGIPLASGMGGSAASAVAALIACNAFLNPPLSRHELARFALMGEELASGAAHADNVVPCLWGGLTLIRALHPLEVLELPLPNLFCTLIHPHLKVPTKKARHILNMHVPLKDHIIQSANLASFIAALYQQDNTLLQGSLNDVVIEPQRQQFVKGFYDFKEKALKAGALGLSFSGSGPSIFAFSNSKAEAQMIATIIREHLQADHIDADEWITRISKEGAGVNQQI